MYHRPEQGISLPLAASIAFHALFLGLYFYFVLLRPETKNVVLNNVDLILQDKEKAQAKNKTLSFLKMALPQLPKPLPELPKPLEQELPKPPPKLAPSGSHTNSNNPAASAR